MQPRRVCGDKARIFGQSDGPAGKGDDRIDGGVAEGLADDFHADEARRASHNELHGGSISNY